MKCDESYDIVIIGGGVIGLACAWQLARAGVRTALLERQQVGREASWAAGGMLAAQCEAAHFGIDQDSAANRAMFALCLHSRALYPEFLEQLHSASGRAIDYSLGPATAADPRRPGILFVEGECGSAAPRGSGLAALVRQREIGQKVIDTTFNGGPAAWLPDEGQVENRDLVAALEVAALRAGAFIHENCAVSALQRPAQGGFVVDAGQRRFGCGRVLLCAGAWSSAIAGISADAMPAVFPRKGEMIALRPARPPRHIIYSPQLYIVPRGDGRTLVGATVEDAGFDKTTSQATARDLQSRAAALCPDLAGAPLEAHWAGLRPATPDGLPLLGLTADDDLWVASGHYRNGILLTPATASLIVDSLLQGAAIPTHFAPDRFQLNAESAGCSYGSGSGGVLCASC